MKIFLSMNILQKEKLVVIKKELLHLWNIADFYRCKHGNEKDCSQRERIALKLYDDINGYLLCIEAVNKEIDKYYSKFGKREDEYLNFLTLYDYHNNKISDLLSIVNLIQSKLFQFQQEHFNQYMPVPNISKRYSTKGFLDYLKIYHTAILKSDGLKDEKYHPITLWGYTDSFRAHQQEDSLKEENCNSNEKYIEIPFWNYEIPFMLPIITHEMGHIVLEHKEAEKKSSLAKLGDVFKKNKEINEKLEGNEGFLIEFLSDMFTLLHHGETYIVVLAHELLGQNFARQFYSKNINDPVSINFIDIDEPKFTEGITRLYLLMEIYSTLREEDNKDEKSSVDLAIEEIRKILDWLIIKVDKDKDITQVLAEIGSNSTESLAKIYHFYYGLTNEYKVFYSMITDIGKAIIKALDSMEEIVSHFNGIYGDIDCKNNNIDNLNELIKYRCVFNQLIEDRLKLLDGISPSKQKIELKNKFRKLILDQDGLLANNEGEAYELAMFKVRTDRFGTEIVNIPWQITCMPLKKVVSWSQYYMGHAIRLSEAIRRNHNSRLIDNLESNINPMYSFDYYSMVALIKKKEELTIKDINKFLKYDKSRRKEIKYYTNKHALILLRKKEDINKSKDSYGYFSVFISLSLQENNSSETQKAVKIIKKQIEEIFKHEDESLEYEIFKSLGPKEIVVHIQKASLKAVFKAKKELFSGADGIFHRSHTVICFSPNELEKIKIEGDFVIGSNIRAKFGAKGEAFKTEHVQALLLTTGVQDYTLQWKKDTLMKDIINFYDGIVGDKQSAKCTDIQTFVVEVLSAKK